MLTDTPKTNKPEDPQYTPMDDHPPWDPRSPMQNRTPINTVDPILPDESLISLDPSASKNTPQCEPYNPVLDPRSPLYVGNRTPIPMTDVEQLPPEKNKVGNENTCDNGTCQCSCEHNTCKGTMCRERRKSTKKKKHHVSVKKTVMLKKKEEGRGG